TMEMMLDKKQIQEIFLFKFKMCYKEWWFKKFCQGDESLEDEEHSGQPLGVDNDELRALFKADPLITTQEVAEELNANLSTVIRHLKQIGKMKKLDKWVPRVLTENQKNHHFEVSPFLFLCNNNEPFLDWIVMCNKNHTCIKNMVMVIVWWSTADLIFYSFLNPGKTITSEECAQQIDEMHQKLQCLQPALTTPNRPHNVQKMLQKLNKLCNKVLLHLSYSPDLLTHFHSQQEAENAFQEINKYISHWQKCVDCNYSCLG
ncbi:hypothetical protein FD754_019712, partial [Muntiacus muntjak]